MKKLFLSLLIIFIFLNSIYPEENKQNNVYSQIYEEIKNDINFFYSYNCGNCIEEKEYLKEIIKLYPGIKINQFEISRKENFDNKELYKYFAYKYQTIPKGVPRTYINNRVFIGFSENTNSLIFDKKYKAYKGCRKQIDLSIKEFSNNLGIQKNIMIIPKIKKYPYIFILTVILFLYILILLVFQEKLKSKKYLKLYLAGFVLIIIIFLYVYLYSLSFSQIQIFTSGKIYPVSVILTALSDGLRPFSFLIPLFMISVLGLSKSKRESIFFGSIYIGIFAIIYFIMVILNQKDSSFIQEYILKIILIFLGSVSAAAGIILMILFLFKTKFKRNLLDIISKKKYFKLLILSIFISLISSLTAIIESKQSSLSIKTFRQIVISEYNNPSVYINILTSILYILFFISPLFLILFNYSLIFTKEKFTKNEELLKKSAENLIFVICGIICLLNLNLN